MTRAGGRSVLPRGPAAPLVASALLLGLAYPPFHLLAPSFLALAPLALWVARLPRGAGGRREALRGGLLVGLLFHSLLLHWLVTALAAHSLLAVPAFLATVAVLAALVAASTAAMHAVTDRLGWPVWLAVPVCWTAMEWLRAHLGDLSFPWMQLGDSLTGWPRVIGAADVVGSRGLSFWLALVSGLVAQALLRRAPPALERWLPGTGPDAARAGPAWRPAAAALLVVAVPLAYSLHRWSALELEPAAEVTVLQPDVAPELKLAPDEAADSARASVDRLLDGPGVPEAGRADLVVLPETVIPGVVGAPSGDRTTAPSGETSPGPAGWITELAGRIGAPVLYGAVDERPRPVGGGVERHNGAFLRGPDGRRLGRYAKRRLVPAVESTPYLEAAWLRDGLAGLLGARFGGFSPGRGPEVLPAGGARFGVLVCYESIFAGLARGYRERGTDFLVNLTNDAWFGRDEPAWMRTSGLYQHPAHLVMRAVETRTGVVRSANSGISGVVDPLGRATRRTELFEPAAFTSTVYTTEGRTLFVRWGDLVGGLAAAAAAAGVVGAGLRRRGGPAPA